MDLRIREWDQFDYFDPVPVLKALRAVEVGMVVRPEGVADVPDRVRRLRVNDLKGIREARDAAIFSHGMAAFLGTKLLYAKASADALHIGIAATNGVDYLLTWNIRHLANASMRRRIEDACRSDGFEAPVLCTPEELMEV